MNNCKTWFPWQEFRKKNHFGLFYSQDDRRGALFPKSHKDICNKEIIIETEQPRRMCFSHEPGLSSINMRGLAGVPQGFYGVFAGRFAGRIDSKHDPDQG